MKAFMKEFKEFISRGNVMDMAVGIIIGGAFTAIVNSLVADIINPLLGCFVSMDFSAWTIPLVGEAALGIGNFINAVISFLIMAFILFSIIKAEQSCIYRQEARRETRRAHNQDLPLLQERDRDRGDKMPSLHISALID